MIRRTLSGFAAFIKEYNIAGMAVAFVMGAKVSGLVASFVNDILMPLIFNPALKAAHVDSIAELSTHGIFRGKFLGTLIDFLIVAFVMYLIVTHLMKKFMKEEKK